MSAMFNTTIPSPSIAAVEPDAFKHAMRRLAGAVSVITVGTDQERTGFTATSVTSLSADGPTVLVTLNRNSSSWPAIQAARSFCVNVLATEHCHVAQSFSGFDGRKGEARYGSAEWTRMATGTWALDGALVAFDCEIEEIIPHRSHAILIGVVRAVSCREDVEPLLYWQGSFGGFEAVAP